MEKEYLDKYYNGDNNKLENDILKKRERISGVFDYDPRDDNDYFNDLSISTGIDFDFF